MDDKIGIIGFGTVGNVLANIFNRADIPFAVYDVLMEDPSRKEMILSNAKKSNAPVLDLPSLIEQSGYIISTVTTQVAEKVAGTCLPYLRQGKIYIDCNSTSPGIKINLLNIIKDSKADFVEGVILNAVNMGDTSLTMLLGGDKGRQIAELFQKAEIKAKFYSGEIGKASMFKMLRSVFSKGVEVLLLEMLVAAKRAGIENDMWKEITTFMDSKPFEEIGGTWIRSHATAYERRYYEMQQVIETLKELGIPPILSQATSQYFEQSVSLKLNTFFRETPSDAGVVIASISDQLLKKDN
jgi:3-hydroxyisobutyrate dehydrogenase-like beta-hydroxyacid dehydrogenase